jgi:hypothetical protein
MKILHPYYKQISIAIGIVVVIAIFVFVYLSGYVLPKPIDEKPINDIFTKKIKPHLPTGVVLLESATEYEDEAIKKVQNYNGKDGKGDRIIDLLQETILSKYSENELLNDSYAIGWYAYEGD